MIFDNALRKKVLHFCYMRALTKDKEEAKISIAPPPSIRLRDQQTDQQTSGPTDRRMDSAIYKPSQGLNMYLIVLNSSAMTS